MLDERRVGAGRTVTAAHKTGETGRKTLAVLTGRQRLPVDRELSTFAVAGNGEMELRNVLGFDIKFALGANGVDAGIDPVLVESVGNDPGLDWMSERPG